MSDLHLLDQFQGSVSVADADAIRETTTAPFNIPTSGNSTDKLQVAGGSVRLLSLSFRVTTNIGVDNGNSDVLCTTPGLAAELIIPAAIIDQLTVGNGLYAWIDGAGNYSWRNATGLVGELLLPQHLVTGSLIAWRNNGPDSPTGQGVLVAVWQAITPGAAIVLV